jgi:hypothetical protein
MALNNESKYPNRRTYVLKLRHDALADALAGRIENLVTGDRLEFESAHALIASIGRDLEAASSEREQQLADSADDPTRSSSVTNPGP